MAGPLLAARIPGARLAQIDGDGHVLDEAGAPLVGLYAVGSCAALTTVGTGYNSGIALGRGLTLAYLVSRELTGDPVPSTERSTT